MADDDDQPAPEDADPSISEPAGGPWAKTSSGDADSITENDES
jgi:hypothetical protein